MCYRDHKIKNKMYNLRNTGWDLVCVNKPLCINVKGLTVPALNQGRGKSRYRES